MVRARLVLLVTIAALVAPWVAPCLTAAPPGHAAMPCCHRGQPVPAARPCCAPADGQPSGPASAGATLSQAAVPIAIVPPSVSPAASPSAREHSKSRLLVQPRVLFSVLLI